MRLDRNSYGTIALVYSIAAAILLPLFLLRVSGWVLWPLTVLMLFCCWFITFFFRVPDRVKAGDDHNVTAVADGKIVILEKVFEPLFLRRDCIQMSIYMDFFDVHACFWPLSATVRDYKYHPGKHLLAFKPKASEDNEHTATLLVSDSGREILFKQLAGGFARRIVCYSRPGLRTVAGEQCGVIKFGSRIDIFLPLDAEILVSLGDGVRACETILARI